MSEYRKRKGSVDRHKAFVERHRTEIEDITDQAMRDIDHDTASLYDFFQWCRRRQPKVFHSWSIEDFRLWNERRIDAMEIKPPAQSTEQALADIRGRTGHRTWDPIQRRTIADADFIKTYGQAAFDKVWS